MLQLAVVGLRFSLLLCFSSYLFGLVAFLEEETLGLDGQEQALESMKQHRNSSAYIPIPGRRKKNEDVETGANEHTKGREEKNINCLYSSAASLSNKKRWERLIYECKFYLDSMT